MPIDSTLSFLDNRIVIYYAGLDQWGLPFAEGQEIVRRTANEQITYLKILSLVSDHIIIPPSFYFFWVDSHRNPLLLDELADLYKTGIIISTFYSSMNLGVEFLEYKKLYGGCVDRNLIKQNINLLDPFFRQLPVIHRDVQKQARGFRSLLMQEYELLKTPSSLKKDLDNLIFDPRNTDILITRDKVNEQISHALIDKSLSQRVFRKFYYATNRSYYLQGALTHNAFISLLGAERYSVLGHDFFQGINGVLLAYDPLVILGILESLGISKEFINSLDINQLVKIREKTIWKTFRNQYHSFAVILQQLELESRRLSVDLIRKLKSKYIFSSISRYISEQKKYSNYIKDWNIGEMSVFALALGTVGFFVIPIVGALLGFLPIVIYKTGITPYLSNFVIDRLFEKETSFYLLINELKDLVEELKHANSES